MLPSTKKVLTLPFHGRYERLSRLRHCSGLGCIYRSGFRDNVCSREQWRGQLWGIGARASSTTKNVIFSSLWRKSES